MWSICIGAFAKLFLSVRVSTVDHIMGEKSLTRALLG